MSAALEPVTRQRLDQFRKRYRSLQLTRGLAAALLIAWVVLVLVVTVDGFVVLPEPVRWFLSLAIYGLGVGWLLFSAWKVVRRQSLESTAQQFERQDPRLHEQLLTAVELSRESEANRLSSASFRRMIQQQVAALVAPVRVAELLPWSMVMRGLALAGLALAIGVGLSWVPGLNWTHRVARALLPGANLGRISRFHVEVISPNPASTLMPRGDVVAIEARVRGPLPELVQLETRIAGQQETSSMRGVTRLASDSARVGVDGPSSATAVEVTADDLVYTANLTLDNPQIEYRILAEDAHTPWYRLTTSPRPQVTSFRLTIVPPGYTSLSERSSESDVGDAEALRGSQLKLELTCDQAIEKGWLQINKAGATEGSKVDLLPMEGQEGQQGKRLRAQLPIDDDFSYRVHLVAADSKFTNAFSSEYQVRAIMDDPPRLRWIKPETSMLVVEPNQLVPLQIHVEDELPPGELSLLTSVNDQQSAAFPMEIPAEADFTAAFDLDLLKIRPRLGDTVRLLVQATDRAGQATLSTAVDLIVSSTAIDPERRPATEQRIELASDLRKFSEQIQPSIKRIRELHEQLAKASVESPAAPSAITEFKQTARQVSESSKKIAKEIRAKVVENLKLGQDSVSLSELELTGQVLARLETDLTSSVQSMLAELDATETSPDAQEKQQLEREKTAINQVRAAVEKVGDASSSLDRRFREFVAHDVLSEVARGLSIVQDFQTQLAASADETPPAQLKRRQSVVARQLRELEQVMVDRSPLLRDGASHGIRSWIEWSGQMAERIERATSDRDDNPNFKEFTRQVLNEVSQHQSVMNIDNGLAGEIINGRKELATRGDNAAATLTALAKLADQSAKVNQEQNPDAANKASAALEKQLSDGLQLLQHRKELEQVRGDSDAYHVSDLGNAIRATRQMMADREKADLGTVAKQMTSMAAAIKKLEAIHNVAETGKFLADLEQIERWSSNSVDARIESPRAWDALQQRLDQSVRALGQAGIDRKLVEPLDSLRGQSSMLEASQKISSRRWNNEAQATAEAELADIRNGFDAARAGLDEIARQARAELAALAPSIPELARKAAQETDRLQKETSKLQAAAAADEVPDLKSRLDQLTIDQQRTSEPISDLREALTEIASMQDLLDDKERAVARDADTSQHIIDQASEQINEALTPARAAENSQAAAEPLQKAANTQREATAALEQIADHFQKLADGQIPDDQLDESRQALKKMASDLDMAAMDEWYKTAESLSKLAGGDPQQVLKKLEEELNRNLRMREELSDLAKQAVDESVKSLSFSAEQERNLQSQLEQSDPAFAARKSLLQQDIQAANERILQWMQQLSNDTATVAARAGARTQQKQLAQLQEQLQLTIADASSVRDGVPLEDMQRIADAIVKNLANVGQDFAKVAEAIEPSQSDPVHASEQELRGRKREMEDWERRTLQQQARGAQAVERSHEQRSRQADNAKRNAESLMRNAQRQRDDLAKQAADKPDSEDLKQRLKEAERTIKRLAIDSALASQREEALKQRLADAKATGQEMNSRKPTDLNSQNPTAELATRFARSAAKTSEAIAQQLEQALEDSGWSKQLAAAQEQLQSSEEMQERVERSVGNVAGNLERAARHEQRLEHPQAAERIQAQAAQVTLAKDKEVHTAREQLNQALATARSQNASDDEPPSATPESSLAARQSVSDAETELRARVRDLKAMLEKPPAEEPLPAKDQPMEAPAEPSVPLDPKMLARMLDELDRQMSSAESNPAEEAGQEQQSQSPEAGQSQDDNNQASSQQNSQGSRKAKGSKTASMQEASRQLAEQMNRQRAQNRQSTASSRMTSNTADTKAQPPSAVRVLGVDRRTGNDWGKLREQAAEQTVESARQSVAPQYRQPVETYFRVLSERGHGPSK